MKTWGKDEDHIALKITKKEWIKLGLPLYAIPTGELRGEYKTYGPWDLPISYKALAMSGISGNVAAYGLRTLVNVSQSGYCLEGRVSINGKRYRGFTSSQLFDVDGTLVSVACIHVCIK